MTKGITLAVYTTLHRVRSSTALCHRHELHSVYIDAQQIVRRISVLDDGAPSEILCRLYVSFCKLVYSEAYSETPYFYIFGDEWQIKANLQVF